MANATNGKSAHHNRYVACGRFATTATLAFGGGPNGQPHNPWGENSHGHRFYAKVLAQSPATVQAAIALANTALGLKPRQVQDHLRWLYTWHPYTYLAINGQHCNPTDVATLHIGAVATQPQLAALAALGLAYPATGTNGQPGAVVAGTTTVQSPVVPAPAPTPQAPAPTPVPAKPKAAKK